MSKPPRARYRTTNRPAYNASLKRRGSLMVWLDPELQWQAVSSGRAGRPAVFNDAAIQFCLTLKCMFGLGPRQAIGLAESLLKLAQLDWNVPDYSTLSRRQKVLSVAITARSGLGGLHLLGDAPMLPQLLAQIPEDELLHSVSADGAFDTRACHGGKSPPASHSHHPDSQKRRALGRKPGGSSSKK